MSKQNSCKVPFICPECGETKYVFPCRLKYKKYCSRECAKSGKNHPMFGKENKWGKHTKETKKNQRKVALERMKNGVTESTKHKMRENHRDVSGKNNPNWQEGKSFEKYGIEFDSKLKKRIRKRDKYKCRECHYTEKQLGYKLSIHHIDYDKKNYKSTNLISLCKSCHCKTNYKREDWINYFKIKV